MACISTADCIGTAYVKYCGLCSSIGYVISGHCTADSLGHYCTPHRKRRYQRGRPSYAAYAPGSTIAHVSTAHNVAKP
eukprot:5328-Rhodomonas_salina.2